MEKLRGDLSSEEDRFSLKRKKEGDKGKENYEKNNAKDEQENIEGDEKDDEEENEEVEEE